MVGGALQNKGNVVVNGGAGGLPADTRIASELLAYSADTDALTPQNPTGPDAPMVVTYGAGASHPDVTIDANGDVTFIAGNTYNVALEITYARAGSGGVAVLLLRGLIDGIQVVDTVLDSFENANSTLTAQFSNFAEVLPGSVLTSELIRDLSGADDGGLYAFDPSLVGVNSVPSASMTISRLNLQ